MFVLTTGAPNLTYVPGQISYPLVDYHVLGRSSAAQLAEYRVISDLPSVVPASRLPLLMWKYGSNDLMTRATAQYLGNLNVLPSSLPVLSSEDELVLRDRHPGQILLMSLSGTEFPAAIRALDGYHPHSGPLTVLASGNERLYVQVIDVRT
jgi:hypothetical protein